MINYILTYILEDESLVPLVGYTSDEKEWGKYKIVIIPSSFFCSSNYGKTDSEPKLPLKTVGGAPILFGTTEIASYAKGKTLLVYADFIASAFFMLSRYEEWIWQSSSINAENLDEIKAKFDVHGRFKATESLAYRAGFLSRPIIQEYGRILRDLLCVEEKKTKEFSDIYLTHDVDTLSNYRSFRGFCGGLMRSLLPNNNEKISDVLTAQFSLYKDPAFTFPLIVKEDAKLEDAKKIYFIKSSNGRGFDYPQYKFNGKDFNRFISFILPNKNIYLGLHTSYQAGAESKCVPKELSDLRIVLENKGFKDKITLNRYHYLRTLKPNDFRALIDTELLHDFTMGYADRVGFRLGTCKPVRWIDPETKELTPLILYPLSIMDSTLSRKEYMNLDENKAFETVKEIIDKTYQYNGELVLLWHNTSFNSNTYHISLYKKIIDFIANYS